MKQLPALPHVHTWVAIAAVILSSCGTFDTRTAAQQSLQAALECQTVELHQVSEFQYRGAGCGRRALAVCTSQALEPSCEILGATPPTQQATPDD